MRIWLAKGWRRWLRFTEILGTIQMVVLLSLVYWTLLAVTAAFFKVLSDPLKIRRSGTTGWKQREAVGQTLDSMKHQF